MSEKRQEFIDVIVDMNDEDAIRICNEVLADETMTPDDILGVCRDAMDVIGQKFEVGEYFVPELIMAGDMLEQISDIIKPLMQDSPDSKKEALGKVLIGTVQGDLHDIGKNIVTFMLEVNGFDVVDLGIDVPVQDFVDKIEEFSPNVVCLSGFLTLAFDAMKETVGSIGDAGQRDNLKIMIGGGQIDELVLKYTGADAFGLSAMDAVTQCKTWTGGVSA